MTIIILFKSYFNTDGYLSPDSTNYLALAQSLLDGKGLYTSSSGSNSQDLNYFAIWPAGYPMLIAFFSKLTGLSVFWASKLTNIILIFGILAIFFKFFGKFAYAYGFILLFGSYIEIYSFTWSEAPFIFGLVFFATAISKLIQNQSSKTSKWFPYFIGICLASLALFFSRYVGIFSTGIIGILSLYFILKRKFKIGSALIVSLIFNGIVVFGYLYNNINKTGYYTGIPRIPAPETNFELTYSLFKSFVSEFVFPLASLGALGIKLLVLALLCQIIILTVWFARSSVKDYFKNRKFDTICMTFFGVGVIYLIMIITMRWLVHFDGFSYRLIAPGTLLIFIGFLRHLELSLNKKDFKSLSISIFFIAFMALFCQGLYSTVRQISLGKISYFENIGKIKKDYKDIETRSVVVFGDIHLKYLRPDISMAYPKKLPSQKENFNRFLSSLDQKRHVYIKIPEKINADIYDKSVIDFVEKYQVGDIIKIR